MPTYMPTDAEEELRILHKILSVNLDSPDGLEALLALYEQNVSIVFRNGQLPFALSYLGGNSERKSPKPHVIQIDTNIE
jgi:hypothetical protein